MKKKILSIGAVLTLAVPLFAFANDGGDIQLIEKAPEVNNEVVNEQGSTIERPGFQEGFERGQMRGHMRGQGMQEQRPEREQAILDNVKEYDPELAKELEALQAERESLREQYQEERAEFRENEAVRGDRQGNRQNRGHGMMGNRGAWNSNAERGQHCFSLDEAITSGDEALIKERMEDMLTHQKERNQFLEDRLGE